MIEEKEIPTFQCFAELGPEVIQMQVLRSLASQLLGSCGTGEKSAKSTGCFNPPLHYGSMMNFLLGIQCGNMETQHRTIEHSSFIKAECDQAGMQYFMSFQY